ncbi:Fis family transcriptional regulator [Cupriavidus sp. USMAA2-4]|uniref:sigma-54 interaction domain-containing protein n=1 Tax=Cupriavidus sp. USMAA2-4 TaxID=876364 RepID=UPI0008A6D176|nr:sigma-54 dependent transcriptional regulator [Cupriavidus sp. USMAA2-4]AOY90718.1 Fis family transcriptional regulator [Cupriavidus sp. USMAA2-4]
MATLPVWPPPLAAAPPESPALEWIFADARSKALLAEVEQVAPSDASVLITGETGTGKELIARHLHSRSARSTGPFLVVSCGAFSESLVDAELFGHENGAFAGAFGSQAGWFEQADGGTIFLDEVNDLPLPVQNKLLRVLQEREVIRLGGRKPIPVDLRFIAASTVDLEELVREKRFRKDLYYRLNVVNLNVLTLKERPGDIVPLARYFIDLYSRRLGYPRLALAPEAERLLVEAPWNGNVRELENVIHRTLLQCEGDHIDAASLRLSQRPPCTPPAPRAGAAGGVAPGAVPTPANSGEAEPLQQAVRRLCDASVPNLHQVVEDALFREVFRYCHYSQSETARLLGVSRNIVRARLIRLGEVGAPRRPAEYDDDNTNDLP